MDKNINVLYTNDRLGVFQLSLLLGGFFCMKQYPGLIYFAQCWLFLLIWNNGTQPRESRVLASNNKELKHSGTPAMQRTPFIATLSRYVNRSHVVPITRRFDAHGLWIRRLVDFDCRLACVIYELLSTSFKLSFEHSREFRRSKLWDVLIALLVVGLRSDYRYECVSRKVRVGTGQYSKWIEGFTT
jgi:hypothetical protein